MELDSLYQEIILDHYKRPRGSAHHVNPTCGDEITVQVSRDAEGGLQIGYEGQGCSISQASASVLTELLTGHTIAESQAAREAFVELMHAQGNSDPDEDILGDAVAFAGVAKFPARVKCALLAWMALQDAEIKAGLLSKGDA